MPVGFSKTPGLRLALALIVPSQRPISPKALGASCHVLSRASVATFVVTHFRLCIVSRGLSNPVRSRFPSLVPGSRELVPRLWFWFWFWFRFPGSGSRALVLGPEFWFPSRCRNWRRGPCRPPPRGSYSPPPGGCRTPSPRRCRTLHPGGSYGSLSEVGTPPLGKAVLRSVDPGDGDIRSEEAHGERRGWVWLPP